VFIETNSIFTVVKGNNFGWIGREIFKVKLIFYFYAEADRKFPKLISVEGCVFAP
jgi:hypothetical protein